MKAFIVVFGLLLVGCAPANVEEATANSVHENSFAVFEMPAGWSLVEDVFMDTPSGSIMMFVPQGASLEDRGPNVLVEVQPSWTPRGTFAEIGEDFIDFIEAGVASRPGGVGVIVAHSHFETSFGEVIEVDIDDELEGEQVSQRQFYFLVDDFMGVVTATYYGGDEAGVFYAARVVVDTIEFGDPGEAPSEAPEPFVLPDSPYKGEWVGQIYWNEFLGFGFEIPEEWQYFPREFIANVLGLEAEESIELMAASEYNELIQVFVAEYEEGQSLADFLLTHTEEAAEGEVDLVAGDIGEVVISGEVYTYIVNTISDSGGNILLQHNFARMINDDTILTILFLHSGDIDREVIDFLEAALISE